MRPTVLYFSVLNWSEDNRTLLSRCFDVVEMSDPRAETDQVLSNVDALTAPLGFPVTDERMARAPRLKVIMSNTTGIPHIDAAAAAKRGIQVCALHDEQPFLETITPTAEHAIGLMIAAWRRIPAAHAAALAGQWSRAPWGAPRMFSRMSIGVVGFGRLGRKVARIAEAMDMQVRWYDPYVRGGAADLLSLARQSDVLSLHAPANAETNGLISRAVLAAMPRGGLVVNTARGELLDEAALLDLLESGHLGAAALDVIDGEYDPDFPARYPEHPLVKYARAHDNLLLTPHIGGSTIDAWHETQRRVIVKAAEVFGLSLDTPISAVMAAH